ncbi:MAG: hypothetical protein PHW86_01140 [Candidatus Bipolaricaulis sp.]|nr:hypothetical protein [Candidatus Bipolaricaulis sp.]
MLSVPELFARLERRARAIRGASWAATAWMGTAAAVSAALLAARLWVGSIAPILRAALLVLPFAAGAVGYVLGHRPRPRLPKLLLAVDQRLGLEARVSSLLELSRKPALGAFAARITRDLERLAPQWSHGLPLGRRPWIFGLVGTAVLVAALAFPPFVASSPAAVSSASPAELPGTSALRGEEGRPVPEATSEGPVTRDPFSASPLAPPLPARSGALRDILAELRPSSGAATASSAIAPESEGTGHDLRDDLERLSDRLDRNPGPLDPAEENVLRGYVAAASPERKDDVEDAVAASDLDALRRMIHQLLDEPSPEEEPAEAGSAVSRLAPEATPPAPSQPPSAGPGPGAPEAPGPDRTGAGTLGDDSSPEPRSAGSEAPPVFDRPEVGVVPVSPPSVLGARGDYSEFLTRGVPVEAPPAGADTRGVASFSFAQIDSVLLGRTLPDGAVDTIRTYFERITEETP